LSHLSLDVHMGNPRHGDLLATTCKERIICNKGTTNHPYHCGYFESDCNYTLISSQYIHASLLVVPPIQHSLCLHNMSPRPLRARALVTCDPYSANNNVSQCVETKQFEARPKMRGMIVCIAGNVAQHTRLKVVEILHGNRQPCPPISASRKTP
jgi:hypothetical protein